ncbi:MULTISPECIES: C-terminal binding protein [unclassified Oceanispirochaeta]|uniref:C-terminal binding protein n=1 Tax=unclassified Oceanispirochaeta TaxID=2635722 RepID=UPI000E09C5D2|nr:MULTISPECIES: C-terminal binding protein [unclassified Oceanispirochaeta]MBF9017360.1 C-terminal binding protein [Oceanispirochaeta sp. M2]NPD73735.1 C-terminal binding protein [Oceanispirochaeta sp. M1]RDG30488.1 C-terminal binding protein [Oceanispirochaeta sp. M1]
MSPYRVVITDNLFDDCIEEEKVFKDENVDLEIYSRLDRKTLLEKVRSADALLLNMVDADREFIDSLDKCKIISRYGIGYDNVDVEAAREKGISVGIVPDYCSIEVAEHAAAMLLSVARRIPQRHELVRKGHWRDSPGHSLFRIQGSVLGILGYGKTGKALHKQVSGFGFSRVLIHSRGLAPGTVLENGAEAVSLDTLLKETDYLSVHLPLTDETRHLLDHKKLNSMKKGAVLVNTARGGILDESALYTALTTGPLRAAGLDVMESEPPEQNNPLLTLDNVVISDHEAYYSEHSVVELKRKTAENVLAVLKTGKAVFSVDDLRD